MLLAPGVAAVAMLGYGVMTGAVAVSFAVSGMPFTLSADSLSGDTFTQYGTAQLVSGNGVLNLGSHGQYDPITVTELGSATIQSLHQTVCGTTPFGNILEVDIATPPGSNTTASSLVVGAPLVGGTGGATFSNINIGQDLGSIPGHQTVAETGMFAQSATHVVITGLQQNGISTAAGTFNLPANFTVAASFQSACQHPLYPQPSP